MANRPIAPQFRNTARNTGLIVNLLTPFRQYERMSVLPKARHSHWEDLVFIVGHWRSGTTLLHNLMCQDMEASFVSTYQTVFANFMGTRWLFRPIMSQIMPGRRPADNVRLAAELPQEEEFAFSNVNPHTYYRYMYFPRYYREYYDESIHFHGLDQQQIHNFAQDYRDVLQVAHYYNPKKKLIIKNPVNTARLPWLREEYPEAKFIFIYRNPYEVFRSTYRFFAELLPTLWFEPVDDEFLKEMIFDVYVRLLNEYDEARRKLPDESIIEIQFENFRSDPVKTLQRIYDQLGFTDFNNSRAAFERYLSSQKKHKQKEYVFDPDQASRIQEHWGEYIDRWEYKIPNGQ